MINHTRIIPGFLDGASYIQRLIIISGTFILKDKPQLLSYYEALQVDQVKDNPVKTEAEDSKNWELIAPVIEIHGDSFAPKVFNEYMEVWGRISFENILIKYYHFTIVCFVENVFFYFLNFKMKIPHTIADSSKLSFAEICCYREDEHGRKTMEKVPNRATVLFNNPEVM